MKNKLNIGKYIPISTVNGPGIRTVFWLQGCSLDCPDCYNQEFRQQIAANILSINDILDIIMSNRSMIEGVTFSGGEPFNQAEGLCVLADHLIREGLNIMCYSGFTLEHLINYGDVEQKRLLKKIDILIDGPYIKSLREFSYWKGSSNQRIHIFNKSLQWILQQPVNDGIEVIVDEKGDISITGSFEQEIAGIFY